MPTEIKPQGKRITRRENIGPYDVPDEGSKDREFKGRAARVDEGNVHTYRAGRILDIGEDKRMPGELVPEALTWFRLMNLVHTGYLKDVEVSKSEFDAAVQKYCPELADELADLITVDRV